MAAQRQGAYGIEIVPNHAPPFETVEQAFSRAAAIAPNSVRSLTNYACFARVAESLGPGEWESCARPLRKSA